MQNATNTKATKATNTKAAKPTKRLTKAEAEAKQQAALAAITSRGLARDAATVTAQATNFDQYSDRDTAYLRFFGGVMRQHNGSATLGQIHDAGKAVSKTRRVNPHYTGSAKATDAGAINRLIKAGYITASADGNKLTVTDAGKAQAAYNGKA